MLIEHGKYFSLLTTEQLKVYDCVVNVVNRGNDGFYFDHGYGGTGKTFVWKALSTKL